MPITLGGRTYSDDEVRQFYASGGNEAAFAQQNGLSDAEAQSAMSQARSITSSPASPAPASASNWTRDPGTLSAWMERPTGLSYKGGSGIYLPDGAEISKQQIADYFNTNPSNQDIGGYALKMGLNQYQVQNALAQYKGEVWAGDIAAPYTAGTIGGSAGGAGRTDMPGQTTSGTGAWGTGRGWGGNSWSFNDGFGGYLNAKGGGTGGGDPGTPRTQQSQSFTGVNSVDHNKGVFSPTENRWISNDEIKQYFAANPGASATELNRLAGGLGLNPYSINYAASVGTGGGLNPTYWQLAADLASSQHRGDSGYGADLDAANRADSNALVAGAGNIQYQMPDGSYYSVRVKDGKPQESYASALQNFNAMQAANPGWHNGGNAATVPTPKRPPIETYQPWTRPTQTAAPVVTPGQVSGNPAVTQTPAIAQTPLQPPTNSFPTPVLNALYAAQQQRMLSPAPTFNFQNGMQAQPTGTTGPLTQVAQQPAQGAMPALPPQIQPPTNPYGGVPNQAIGATVPWGPGHPGWVNSKDGSGLTPGTGGGDPYQPGPGGAVAGTSLNLPSTWGGMGAAEKINWFNQNNVSVDAMRQNGVADDEIAWMKQNGYTAGGPAAGAGGPNPGDLGFFTTRPPEEPSGPGGWQEQENLLAQQQTGGGNPNPYASNGWVASGSGGTKPGAGGSELHPGPGLGGGGFNPIDPGFNINPGAPVLTNWQEQMQPYVPPGTGGMEPMPAPQPIPQSWGRSAPTPEPTQRVMPAGGFSGLLGGTNVAEIYNSQPRNFAQGGALTRVITQR